MARANQSDVAHLQLADDNGEVSEAAAEAIKLVGYILMDAAGPDLRQHLLKPGPTDDAPEAASRSIIGGCQPRTLQYSSTWCSCESVSCSAVETLR